MEINLLNKLPGKNKPLNIRKTVTPDDRILSWRLGYEYFDGSREQGCGGYYDDNRWRPVAEDFIDFYKLNDDAKILDIGCAKGFLLKEFKQLLPNSTVCGLDVSEYAVTNCVSEIEKNLYIGNADNLPFKSDFFDLVISINSLHNIMNIEQLKKSFSEINRVSKKNSFVSLGAYENDEEKDTLDNWAVVATTYMHVAQWKKFFESVSYKGDYFWFKPK
tara:strand:+ start:1246 stop:1899 length:654 start_codon:yes stop_codon:yes gene_type:complete